MYAHAFQELISFQTRHNRQITLYTLQISLFGVQQATSQPKDNGGEKKVMHHEKERYIVRCAY